MCKCEILIYLILMIFMSWNISSYFPKETSKAKGRKRERLKEKLKMATEQNNK